MAEKKYFHDLKLVGSVVRDDAGNQTSLTSQERLGVVNALGGPVTETNPVVAKQQYDNDWNAYRAGVRWRNPVKYVGYSYPVLAVAPGTPAEGDKYVSSVDGKLYTYTSSAWDTGVVVPLPDKVENHAIRVLDIASGKIYQITAGVIDAGTDPVGIIRFLDLVSNKIFNFDTTWDAGETPDPNWTVEESDTDQQWTYDDDATKWICNSAGKIPYATTTVSGKVMFTENGGTDAFKAVQGNDSRLLKGYHAETLTNVSGTVTITHGLGTHKLIIQSWVDGQEADIQVSRNVADPENAVDLVVNGGPITSVELYLVALP